MARRSAAARKGKAPANPPRPSGVRFTLPPEVEDRYNAARESIALAHRRYHASDPRGTFNAIVSAAEQTAAGRALEMLTLRDPLSSSREYLDVADSVRALIVSFQEHALRPQIGGESRNPPTPNYSREQMRQDLAGELAYVERKIPAAREAVRAAREEVADAKRRDLYPHLQRDAARRLRDAETHLAVVEADQRHYAAQLARNPDEADDLRAELAGGDNAHAAVATAIAIAPDVPPSSNPRGLVQLGGARQLDVTIADGEGKVRRYRWTLADDWRTLAPAGAEALPAGAGRLFLVPPPSSSSSEPPADSAGVRTFVEWHQFEPREAFSADVPTVSEFSTRLGTARSIVYRSDKWQPGEPLDYEHEFKPSDPPCVFVIGNVEAPRSVLVRGGAFRVTARGLVD